MAEHTVMDDLRDDVSAFVRIIAAFREQEAFCKMRYKQANATLVTTKKQANINIRAAQSTVISTRRDWSAQVTGRKKVERKLAKAERKLHRYPWYCRTRVKKAPRIGFALIEQEREL